MRRSRKHAGAIEGKNERKEEDGLEMNEINRWYLNVRADACIHSSMFLTAPSDSFPRLSLSLLTESNLKQGKKQLHTSTNTLTVWT